MTDLIREASRLSLRERIAYHERTAVELKRDLNALNPCVDLPVELITRICRLVRDDCHEKCRRKIISREKLTTIPWFNWLPGLLHVCHRWRVVALGDAQLWSRVVARPRMHPGSIKMQIERSGRMPLSLTFDCRTTSGDTAGLLLPWWDVLWPLIPELPRACAYLIFQEEPIKAHGAVFAELMDHPAPQVHTIEHYILKPSARGQPTWYVPQLFTGVTPGLRNVTIDGPCGLKWSNLIFCASVTHLHVSRLCNVTNTNPKDFLDALRRMPSLETVELSLALPLERRDLEKPDRPMELWPRLHQLTLRDTIACITAFFAHVSVPLSTSIHLHAQVDNRAAEERTSAELADFRTTVAAILDRSPKEMMFSGHDVLDEGPFVCWWRFPDSPVAPLLPPSSFESPDLSSARLSLHVPSSYTRPLHDIVPASAAAVLVVGEYGTTLDHRTEAGPLLAGAMHIDLYGYPGDALADILAVDRFLRFREEGREQHAFPALRVLRLLDGAWDDDAPRGDEDLMPVYARKVLRDGLERRRERGFPDLEEIAFVRYDEADASRMDWLERYVGKVSYHAVGEPTRPGGIPEVFAKAKVLGG